MTAPIRGTLDEAARALADAQGISEADARGRVRRWLELATPTGGVGNRARYRKRGEADVTYTLTEDGEVAHVQLRLGSVRGKGAERRHRDRQAERRTWHDDAPADTQTTIRLPSEALAEIDEEAQRQGVSRSEYLRRCHREHLSRRGPVTPTQLRELASVLEEERGVALDTVLARLEVLGREDLAREVAEATDPEAIAEG